MLSFSLFTVALFLPVPAIVVILLVDEYEFIYVAFPPTLCHSKDVNVIYYSVILIINIVFFIGVPMLLYLLWTLHKVYELKHGNTAYNLFSTLMTFTINIINFSSKLCQSLSFQLLPLLPILSDFQTLNFVTSLAELVNSSQAQEK